MAEVVSFIEGIRRFGPIFYQAQAEQGVIMTIQLNPTLAQQWLIAVSTRMTGPTNPQNPSQSMSRLAATGLPDSEPSPNPEANANDKFFYIN
jgi:hypothetical protein